MTCRIPSSAGARKCAEFEPPAQKLGAHVAALGMRFYTGSMFPPPNTATGFSSPSTAPGTARKKIGYRISIVKIEGGKAVSYQPFARGWLQGESAWGRPVDLEMLPDGSLAVSDDGAGLIYRISYSGPH